MVVELQESNLVVEQEKSLQVYYNDTVVGNFYVDLFVEDNIPVELKSTKNIYNLTNTFINFTF